MSDSASEMFGRDLGLMHELVVTSRKVGFTRDDWATLTHSPDLLGECLAVVRGSAAYTIVNLYGDPPVPEGWRVREHERGSKRYFDITKANFYCPRIDGRETWNEVMRQIACRRVANACLLQRYLEFPELIPEECRGKRTLFLGTQYIDPSSHHKYHVLGLEYDKEKDRWKEQPTLIGIPLDSRTLIALLD